MPLSCKVPCTVYSVQYSYTVFLRTCSTTLYCIMISRTPDYYNVFLHGSENFKTSDLSHHSPIRENETLDAAKIIDHESVPAYARGGTPLVGSGIVRCFSGEG